jgi:hypothetical protein
MENKYYWGVSIKNRDRNNAKLWIADSKFDLIKVINHCYKGNHFSKEAQEAAKKFDIDLEKDLNGMRIENSYLEFKHNMELDQQHLNFKKPIEKINPKEKYYVILLKVSDEKRKAGDTSSKAIILDKNFNTVDVIKKFWNNMGDYSKEALEKMKKYNIKKISMGDSASDLRNDIKITRSNKKFVEKNYSFLKSLFNKK